mgnify:CR=1 FL=1|jgi:hypothetical protein
MTKSLSVEYQGEDQIVPSRGISCQKIWWHSWGLEGSYDDDWQRKKLERDIREEKGS